MHRPWGGRSVHRLAVFSPNNENRAAELVIWLMGHTAVSRAGRAAQKWVRPTEEIPRATEERRADTQRRRGAREQGPRDWLVVESGPCVTLELKPLTKFKPSFDR